MSPFTVAILLLPAFEVDMQEQDYGGCQSDIAEVEQCRELP